MSWIFNSKKYGLTVEICNIRNKINTEDMTVSFIIKTCNNKLHKGMPFFYLYITFHYSNLKFLQTETTALKLNL